MMRSIAAGLVAMVVAAAPAAAAEARRSTTILLVGAAVPSPSCVVSTMRGDVPDVTCSASVAFVVTGAAPGPGETPTDTRLITVTY